jgi:bifunctional non-homologous end joining protein LigD
VNAEDRPYADPEKAARRLMGLEGLVSKHKDRPYRAGRSKHRVRVKNREHPAMERVMDALK